MAEIYVSLKNVRNHLGGSGGMPVTEVIPAAFNVINDVDATWRIAGLVAKAENFWIIESRSVEIELIFGTAAELDALDLDDTGADTRGQLCRPEAGRFEGSALSGQTFAYRIAPNEA